MPHTVVWINLPPRLPRPQQTRRRPPVIRTMTHISVEAQQKPGCWVVCNPLCRHQLNTWQGCRGVHLVVLLQGSQILAGLAELALLHALADIPVHEGLQKGFRVFSSCITLQQKRILCTCRRTHRVSHAVLTRLLYIRSNLWSRRENTSAMAVLLLIMHTARCTLARSPPGSTNHTNT